jgi:hypothetical protein
LFASTMEVCHPRYEGFQSLGSFTLPFCWHETVVHAVTEVIKICCETDLTLQCLLEIR